MRHLYGTALASVMALVMFFGGAWGYLELLKLPVPPGDPGALPAAGGSLLSNGSVLLALAVLAVTGVLAGLLVAIPRISPLAAGLPGLLLIAWTVLFLFSVRWATAIIPLRSHSFGAGWEALLFNGVLGAAGLVMTVPMFIPARWADSRSSRTDRRSGAAASPGAAARSGGDRRRERFDRDVREPARTSAGRAGADRAGADRAGGNRADAGTGWSPRPGRHATGPITGSVTGPLRPATGPFQAAGRPGTQTAGPIRTTSPIRTTGPIRLNPPEER